MDKRQLIVSLLRNECDRACAAYRHAHAEHAGTIASANAWDESNKEGGVGGFSQNPYRVSVAAEKDERCRVYYQQIKDAYEFAVDTFLSPLSS
jgi:hypothetical protein